MAQALWFIRNIGSSLPLTPSTSRAPSSSAQPVQALAAPQGKSKPPKYREPAPCNQEALEELVGPITESKEMHLKRHDGGRLSCPRCRFYKFQNVWTRAYGSVDVANKTCSIAGGAPCSITGGATWTVKWLKEKPLSFGGAWGVGCAFCADQVARLATCPAATQGKDTRRLRTAWANYEVRCMHLQSCHIRQHPGWDLHRLAMKSMVNPGVVDLRLQGTATDDALMRGNVPQGEDWLRAWRAARTPQSWAAAQETMKTEHYINALHNRAVTSRSLISIVRIMREVGRRAKRELLRQAVSISLAFDDRAGYKLVTFRAVHLAATQGDEAPAPRSYQVTEGIVGCCQVLHGSSLEDFADDYAERVGREVLQVIARLCTPLSLASSAAPQGDVDNELYMHVLGSVHSIMADGALQKCGVLLRTSGMPNIKMVARDAAHCVRIACQQPLVRSDHFKTQHEMLFTDKNALLKGIQFSHELQARLEACQRVVLQHKGAQGGDLRKVMRHFSFANHRFESWTDPRRRYACAIHAIALLLADIAGDMRKGKPERDRAEACLEAMTPQNLFEVGLACDYGEISMRPEGGSF